MLTDDTTPIPPTPPLPPAPLPKVENLTISNVTPFGFRVSWGVKQRQPREESAHSVGAFRHFDVVVTDSGWLLEPQKFTVPGNQSHLDVWGLITGIGYEIRLTGVSKAGLFSRPLTAVAVTGSDSEGPHPWEGALLSYCNLCNRSGTSTGNPSALTTASSLLALFLFCFVLPVKL